MRLTVLKTFPVFIASCYFFLTAVYAQGERSSRPQGGPPSAEDMVQRMRSDLDLTDEQVEKITEIFEEQQEQMKAQMSSGTGRPDRDQMEAQRETIEKKLAAVLTSEQLEKWKSHRPQDGPNGSGKRPPQPR